MSVWFLPADSVFQSYCPVEDIIFYNCVTLHYITVVTLHCAVHYITVVTQIYLFLLGKQETACKKDLKENNFNRKQWWYQGEIKQTNNGKSFKYLALYSHINSENQLNSSSGLQSDIPKTSFLERKRARTSTWKAEGGTLRNERKVGECWEFIFRFNLRKESKVVRFSLKFLTMVSFISRVSHASYCP